MSDAPTLSQSLTTAINPAISAEQHAFMVEAIEAARKRYLDFFILEPLVRTIGEALLLPNWEKVHVDEYVSCLYAVARHAEFCSDVRNKLFQDAAAANLSEPVATSEQERLATFTAAMANVRERQPQVDFFLPVMARIAPGLIRNASELTAAGYIEALYFVSKEADFAEPLRQQFLDGVAPVNSLEM